MEITCISSMQTIYRSAPRCHTPNLKNKTSKKTSAYPLIPSLFTFYSKLQNIPSNLLKQIQESQTVPIHVLYPNLTVAIAPTQHLRIIIENQKERLIVMQECKAAAENTVSDREKMVEVKRKIGILKESLLTERQSNRNLESQLYERGERLKKIELESKKREEKNEGLLLEIRTLKDALITERTEKQQAVQHLLELQRQEKEGGPESKKSLSNMFGWKGLFQK